MSEQQYRILARSDGRFIISDPATGAILDNAQGYGYTSKDKAAKAAWYKFKGGKTRMNAARKEAVQFWRSNKLFAEKLSDLEICDVKHYAFDDDADFNADALRLATEMGIVGFDPKFLKYLP
jgi:hypothetical protein